MTILNPEGTGINPLNGKKYSENYKELAKFWSNLPGYKSVREIIKSIKQNQVLLIRGKTGSGKSILGPLCLWDFLGYDKKILFSLPRQSITLKAAQFQQQISDVPDSDLIGYKFKNSPEGSMTKNTHLLYATHGTILNYLMSDINLPEYSGLIIDELHETQSEVDLMMMLVRETMKNRPEFKLILMSATVDEKIYRRYFKDFKFDTIDMASETTFPITVHYLPEKIKGYNQLNDYLNKGLEIIFKLLDEGGEEKVGDKLYNPDAIKIKTNKTWGEVLNEWRHGNYLDIKNKNLEKYMIFFKPFNNKNSSFEYELIPEDELPDDQDFTPYIDHLTNLPKSKHSVSFMNLTNNIMLIVPKPVKNKNFSHINNFTQNASETHKKSLYRNIAINLENVLNDLKPTEYVYLSTHGLGVPYLHYRIEITPQYFNQTSFIDYKGNVIDENKEIELKNNAILFFVPSIADTLNCDKLKDYKNIYCSDLSKNTKGNNLEQVTSELTYRKEGKSRKIILSTNVAESSLTVPDIGVVIDSGLEYKSYFDPKTNSRVLDKQLVSQAGAIQRRGRAGRRSPGICYNLYSKQVFDKMSKYGIPNILQSDLTQLSLNLLSLKNIKTVQNLKDLYTSFIEPPSKEYIDISIKNLKSLDLISDDQITNLGYKINRFRDIQPLEAKILYTSYQLDCVEETALLITAMSQIGNNIKNLIKPPKIRNKAQQEEMMQDYKRVSRSFQDPTGDHLSILNIFSKYLSSDDHESFIKDNYLDNKIIKKIIKDHKKLSTDVSKIFSQYPKIKSDRSIKDRIFLSLSSGYVNNIASLENDKRSFYTETAKNLKVSQDSFYYGKSQNIFFNELFRQNGKYELNIVSSIPKSLT